MNAQTRISAPVIGTLADVAVLASLSISQWTARKFDRGASIDVTQRNGANERAARVNKQIVPKAALATLAQITTLARTEHERLTLPWGRRGERILGVQGFITYRNTLSALESRFNAAADLFASAYPDLRDAARAELGELYRAEDYPESVRGRFAFQFSFDPVPTGKDFRVDVQADILAEMRRATEERARDATRDAIASIYGRAAECLGRMVERLKAYTPATETDRAQGVFRDSLVENVRELAATLPLLNVFGDPALDRLAIQLADLAKVDASQLRESDNIRAATAAKAEALAASVSAYL
jgi:hypothetical protein